MPGETDQPLTARHLTPREIEVLRQAALGRTNSQVADDLAISVHAVKFHLASVFRKLGVRNRTQAAVVYANGRPEHGAEAERAS